MVESIRAMVDKNVDLYEVLNVATDATPEEIKRAFHKLALLHHPDMKSKSIVKQADFRLILACYEILSDPSLRKQYEDLIQRHDKSQFSRVGEIDAQVQEMQQKLREKEARAKNELQELGQCEVKDNEKRPASVNIELLREEGVRKRRALEDANTAKESKASTSIYDLPLQEKLDFNTIRLFTARLKYRHRPEVKFDETVIKEIMSIFGKVKETELLDQDGKYAYALVEFDDVSALNSATEYDYSTAQKLDGTRVRKLASLLRSCKKEFGPDGEKWTNSATVNAVLDQYVQSVSDKKEVAL